MTVECPYTLQWDDLFPSKLPLPWGIWTPIQYFFPWAHPCPHPNGISSCSAVFAGLTSVTDQQNRPTDHTTRWVTVGRIYVHTAMRPNNKYLSRFIFLGVNNVVNEFLPIKISPRVQDKILEFEQLFAHVHSKIAFWLYCCYLMILDNVDVVTPLLNHV